MAATTLIAFRVDAGVDIGLGHLSRCVTLANALRDRGARILFLTSRETANWASLIDGHGFEMCALNVEGESTEPSPLAHAKWLAWGQGRDADASRRQLPAKAAWLVVDHYALDKTWEAAMRSVADRLMVIDDLADRVHDCDVLLDQNIKSPTSYEGLVVEDCTTLIGPGYALLRPDFFARRRAQGSGSAGCINVFMGGTDSEGATVRILDELLQEGSRWDKLDVILGAKCPHLHSVRDRIASRSDAELHVDSNRVAELFASADIAIGAGGVAALERCCVGLPTLGISVAANQTAGLGALHEQGAVEFLGSLHDITTGRIAASLRDLMAAPERLWRMSVRSQEIVDGRGTRRVADLMLSN